MVTAFPVLSLHCVCYICHMLGTVHDFVCMFSRAMLLFSSRTLNMRFDHCWYIVFFFFFSSRRRHTRFKCDWSSDVCSSDLGASILLVTRRGSSVLAACSRNFPFLLLIGCWRLPCCFMVWANFALRRRFLREDFSRRQPERLVSNSRRPSAGLFPQPRIFRATIGSMPEISSVNTPSQSPHPLGSALFVAGQSLIIS